MNLLNPVKIKILIDIEFIVEYDEVTPDQSNKPFVGTLPNHILFLTIQNNVTKDAEFVADILGCCR